MAERGGAPGCVSVDRDADGGPRAGRYDGVNNVELGKVIDHEGDARAGLLVLGEGGDRCAVNGRISENDIVMSFGEPERFGQREGQDAGVTREREGRVDRFSHPDGFARDPDGDARSAHRHVECVVPERPEVQGRHGAGNVGYGIRLPAPIGGGVVSRLFRIRHGLSKRHHDGTLPGQAERFRSRQARAHPLW